MRIAILVCFFCICLPICWSQTWVKVSAGSSCSMGLKSDGTLWFWGRNNYSEYGDDSFNESWVPIQVGTQNNWTDIECGGMHVLALKADSTIWSWGSNYWGQLGHGIITWIGSPHQIGTDHDWVKIESGGLHNAAIKSNGTLWMWGSNEFGQLGIGNNSVVLSPMQVGTAHNWRQISLGGNHSLGFREEGSELVLYAWGFNGNGQLGQGDTQDRNVPTQLGTLANWNQITAGSSFAYGTLTDATSFSWGFNGLGVLSIGTTQSQNIPYPLTVVSTNINSIKLAAGAPSGNQLYGMHALALSSDSLSICSVGANYTGQLGNGNQNARSFLECDVASFVSIEENPSLALAIYPNPSSGKFTIEAPLEAGQVIALFDLNGQQVFSQEILNSGFNQSLQTKLTPGLYLLKLIDKEGVQLASRRLVVE